MPCDSIIMANVEFNMQSTDMKLFEEALRALGYSYQKTYDGNPYFVRDNVTGVLKDGKIKMTYPDGMNNAELQAEIKRAYSTEVVKSQAKKFGWQLKEKSPGKFAVIKRA